MPTSSTMQCVRLRLLAIALLFRSSYLAAAAESPAPYTMTWSDKSYGPDGPWQAISVRMGSETQPLALYPGGTWASLVFTESFCANTSISSVCYADRSGLFQTKNSETWDNKSIEFAPNRDKWSGLSMGYADAVPVNALAERAMDTMEVGGNKVAGLDLIAISQAYQTYPGGQNFPLEVGDRKCYRYGASRQP
ncbi:uncharacterized protein KD926_007683 [Aspergillus affinis]|uniref:uncharacterized protein n=1 Tax=Aspergillus affinis TaxID=1070780 RepID=UPI0022FDFEE5|nr:uncharacterized protein KD926_007683 [Aspergillus affinis]KAI9040741.1 hypothetical protein KD926_007683 [Aspergillus affinis]